jgi:hypothetical protein
MWRNELQRDFKMMKPYFLLVLLCCTFVAVTISVAQAQSASTVNVTFAVSGNGSIEWTDSTNDTSGMSGTFPFALNNQLNVLAVPASGYQFAYFSVSSSTANSSTTNNPFQINVTSASTITAYFESSVTPTPTPTPTATPSSSSSSDEAMPIWQISLPSYPLWTPVDVVVDYAYTQNYTISVNTYGQSLHQEISSPTSISFTTSAIDTYTIHISVRYMVWVNQTVSVSIEQNSTADQVISVNMNSMGFNIDMMIITSQAPSYPTADQIADATWSKWQSALTELKSSNQNLINSLLGSYAIDAGFSFFAFGVSIVLIITVIYLARKQAKTDNFVKETSG